jgi:hypothetical protein
MPVYLTQRKAKNYNQKRFFLLNQLQNMPQRPLRRTLVLSKSYELRALSYQFYCSQLMAHGSERVEISSEN